MKSVVERQTLDGGDGRAVGLSGRYEATVYQLTVHQYRTGAAFAFTATLFCANQAQLRPKHVQQALHGMDTKRFWLAVHVETNLLAGGDVGGRAHSVCGDPFRRFLQATQDGVNVFGKERDEIERHAEGVLDRIEDGRSRSVHREFSNSLCAVGAVDVAQLLKENTDGRQIGGCGHDVVGHLVVEHTAVLPEHLFVQGKTDSLRDPAGDLPFSQQGVEHSANLLQRDEIVHGDAVVGQVHRNFRDVNSPSECSVRFAAISLVVPEDSWRRFITRVGFAFEIGRASC